MIWTSFKGKKIFLQVETVNGLWGYSGMVNDVVFIGKNIDKVDVYFLDITDIKGQNIGFSSTQVKFIKEEK